MAPTPAVLNTPCTYQAFLNFVLQNQDVFESVEVANTTVTSSSSSITITGT